MKNTMTLALVALMTIAPIQAQAFSPGTNEYYFEQQIAELRTVDSSTDGRLKTLEGATTVSYDQQIRSLQSENQSLREALQRLESKVSALQSQPAGAPVNNTIIQSTDTARIEAIEKRLKIAEQVISMVEVNVGSIYAYVNQALAPIKKLLKIK